MLLTRDKQPEIMDQPGLDETQHLEALEALRRINYVSRSASILGREIRALASELKTDHLSVLEATAARLGVTDHVIFGGFQPDTAAMMAAFDLYVACSVQETFGLAILEAMARGLPVIYTVCPALDGIQTSQARQAAGTAEAMREEIRKAVDAGPQPRKPDNAVFDRYGMESVAHQVDDLYERLLARRRAGRGRRRS